MDPEDTFFYCLGAVMCVAALCVSTLAVVFLLRFTAVIAGGIWSNI